MSFIFFSLWTCVVTFSRVIVLSFGVRGCCKVDMCGTSSENALPTHFITWTNSGHMVCLACFLPGQVLMFAIFLLDLWTLPKPKFGQNTSVLWLDSLFYLFCVFVLILIGNTVCYQGKSSNLNVWQLHFGIFLSFFFFFGQNWSPKHDNCLLDAIIQYIHCNCHDRLRKVL